MFRTILCIFAALVATSASAQTPRASLSGFVHDPAGSAVVGAQVELQPESGETLETRTAVSGEFRFDELAPGRYQLTVKAESFQPAIQEVHIAEQRSMRVEVDLAVAAVRTEVTVRGRRPTDLRTEVLDVYEANKTVTSVEGQMLLKNNPINNYDTLRYLPGVSNAAWAGRDRFSVPSHIRGAGAWGQSETIDDYPALQITPVSAEDGGYTAGFSSVIPSLAVEEMSLATGGLGVVYGQAAGGVLKSRIKTGDASAPHATIRAEGVGIGEALAMGELSGGVENLDYYFSGQTVGGDYGDSFDTFPRPIQSLRGVSGLAKVGYRISGKGRLEGMFVGGDERHSFFQMGRGPEDNPLRRDFHTNKDNYFYAGRYDHRFTKDVVLAGGVTHNRFHENRIEDFAGGVPVDVSRRNRPQRATTGFADLTWRTQFSDTVQYAGSLGTEIRRDRFADITGTPVEFEFGEDAVFWRSSLSWNALTFNGGIRGSNIDNGFSTDGQMAYDVGLAYRLPTRTRLKASYSTGYKLNKPFYLWWGGGNFIRRDPAVGLRPSNTKTTEFGVDQTLVTTTGVAGSVRATVFRTDESDLFNFGNTGTGIPYYDQLRVDGFELWSQWRLGRVRPFVSYTWLDNVRTGSDNPAASNVDLRFAPLPGRNAGFGALVPASNRLNLSVMGSYDNGGIQESLVNDQILVTRYSSFFKVNALASFALTEQTAVLIRAENLLNRRDLGYDQTVLQMDGSAEQVSGVQRDPGLILAGGFQWSF